MASVSEWVRSWKLVRWRSAAVAVVVFYALVGFFLVPWIVKVQIEKRSLEILKRQATVEKVRCNPFTLSLTIEGFSIPDRPGSVLLSWDRVYANAEVSSLFRWAATLKELTIENPYVAFRRFEDGAVNVLELMADIPESEPDQADDGGLPRALLQHARVVNGRIDLEDRHRPEPLLWTYGPSEVVLVNISTIPERGGTNDVVIQLMGGGVLRVNGGVVLEPLGLDGRFQLESVPIANSWRAVAHLFKFDLTGGVLDLGVDYRVGLEDDGIHLAATNAELRIEDFGFQAEEHDQDLLQVGTILVSGGSFEWPEQNLAAQSILIDGASVFGWVQADGQPSWNVLIPEESQEVIVETYETLEERIKASAAVGRFEIRDSGVSFLDETSSPPMRFAVENANLVVTDVSTKEGTMWPLEGSATIEGEATGFIRGAFGAAPLNAEVEIGLENLQLAKYQPYVARFAPLDLRAGVFKIGGTAAVSKVKGEMGIEASFQGGFDVIGLDLNETVTGDKLLGWGDLKVAGIDAKLQPMSALVREVDVDRAGLEITVAEDGTINLLEFLKTLSEGGESGGAGAAAPDRTRLPSVRIARARLRSCYGIYTDRTPSSGPFRMALDPINGTISGIATDSKGAADIDIEAEIDSGGLVRVGGGLDPFDYQRLTDLSIDLRDVQLPSLSPMSVKFIGHPITNGNVSLDLDYDIADRYLTAANHIEADDLELGDKVEGEGMVNLPFKLGVSLLKDKEGRITLDVPFEGSFDTPGFGMATAAGAAAKEIFSELVKSPFKLLGKIGGGGTEQDLEHVEFAAGSAELDERARESLTTLSAGLVERPTLALAIDGIYDPEADGMALRKASFRNEVLGRGVPVEDFEVMIPLDVLEAMFADRLGSEELEAVRARNTAAADEGAPPVLDEFAYRTELRDALVATQPVDEGAIAALAPARAEAMRAFLVARAGLEPGRVTVVPEPESVGSAEEGSTAAGSATWVRCRLELSAL